MKPLSLVLVVCSFCSAAQQVPLQNQAQSQSQAQVRKEEDVDYGPVILGSFLSIIPGIFAFAAGRKDQNNPELAAAGLNQVMKGASQFFGALQLISRSKPGAFKSLMETIEDKELLMAYLDKELESEECVRSFRSLKRNSPDTEKLVDDMSILAV
jgi:hypothetical protein